MEPVGWRRLRRRSTGEKAAGLGWPASYDDGGSEAGLVCRQRERKGCSGHGHVACAAVPPLPMEDCHSTRCLIPRLSRSALLSSSFMVFTAMVSLQAPHLLLSVALPRGPSRLCPWLLYIYELWRLPGVDSIKVLILVWIGASRFSEAELRVGYMVLGCSGSWRASAGYAHSLGKMDIIYLIPKCLLKITIRALPFISCLLCETTDYHRFLGSELTCFSCAVSEHAAHLSGQSMQSAAQATPADSELGARRTCAASVMVMTVGADVIIP